MQEYISGIQKQVTDALEKWDIAVLEDPTNIGKESIIEVLVKKYGKTLFVSQSYDINRQWNEHPEVVKNAVFITYSMFSSIAPDELHAFCAPYGLIIFDEAHHTGAEGYVGNVSRIIDNEDRDAKIFGITTHTKRYSDSAEDVAYSVFHGHKINGVSFEDAIRQGLLPQFDYISALYSMPKDIGDLIASSSLARKIVSDSRLVQINEDGIKSIIRKHMPGGNRKVVYFVPTIEDSEDAEKLAKELGYGKVYAINYTKGDTENREALKSYNESKTASLVCISKFNEGAVPKGTNSVVILRKTMTINIFERQILTALSSATEKPVVYDFVANIDNLIYSSRSKDGQERRYYTERISSLCSQSIVVDYARPWTSVFTKLRNLSQSDWTPLQDDLLRKLYPKYGNDIYKYIKGHSLKECLMRAEILGIVPEKPKTEDIPEEVHEPFRIPFMETVEKLSDSSFFTRRFIKDFVRAYRQMMEEGRIPSDILREISELEEVKADNARAAERLEALADACISATIINSSEDEAKLLKRQENFKTNVVGYVKSCNVAASNVLILDGRAVKGDISGEELKKLGREKKKSSMVLVGNTFMSRNSAIAGRLGNTETEHVLYKIYWRILLGKYKTDNTSQMLKEYSEETVINKIRKLRNGRNAWTDTELEELTLQNPEAPYQRLLKNHSDLDILEKAGKAGSAQMVSYSQKRTDIFEKDFKVFLDGYRNRLAEIEAAKARARKQKALEEENIRKKQEEKKRLKNVTPTIMVVHKKHKKNQVKKMDDGK